MKNSGFSPFSEDCHQGTNDRQADGLLLHVISWCVEVQQTGLIHTVHSQDYVDLHGTCLTLTVTQSSHPVTRQPGLSTRSSLQ